jgi:hypothetical protein
MTTKSLLCVAVLALANLTIASAKSYDIILNAPVKAGSVELKPGAYSVKVKGDTAIFTSASSGKSFTAPVKLDNSGPKHEVTAVGTVNENGSEVLKSIKLGGSATTLEFGE